MCWNRSSLVLLPAVVVLISLISISPAHAKTFKFATIVPDGTEEIRVFRKQLVRVKELTKGEVDIKLYTQAVAGDEFEVVRKMRTSRVDGGAFTLIGISSIVPQVNILAQPSLYRNADEAMFVRDKLFDTFYKDFYDKGYVLLGLFELGTVYVYTKVDFVKEYGRRKLNVLTIKGDWMMEACALELGHNRVPLELSQGKMALQTEVIDTIATIPFGLTSMQWHPYIRYALDYPLTYLPGAFLFSKQSFESLSPESQKTLKAFIRQAVIDNIPTLRQINRDADAVLDQIGVIRLKLTDRIIQDYEKKLRNAFEKALAEGRYSKALNDEVQAAIQEYRSKK